jgi:transposase
MSKVSKAKPHLSNKELEGKIKKTVGFWRVQKWLIIYNALNYPRRSEEIANHLAVSKSLVNKTISEYNRRGASAIETIGKGGRKNSYMTLDEEKKFMTPFILKAEQGQIATTGEIKENFEKRVGSKVHKTTIYRLLARHGWRKIVPRSYHPKKDEQAQEDFKKTS